MPILGALEVFEEEVHLVGVERVEVNAFVDAATTVTLFRGVLGGAGEVRRELGDAGRVFGDGGVERFDVVPGEAPDPMAGVTDAASFGRVAGDVLVFFGGVELEPVEVDGDIGTGCVGAAEHEVGGGGR